MIYNRIKVHPCSLGKQLHTCWRSFHGPAPAARTVLPTYKGPLESMLPAYCSHLKLRYTRFTVLLFILLRSHILNLPAQYLHLKEFYWRITTHIISTPFTGKQHATINLTTLQYTQLITASCGHKIAPSLSSPTSLITSSLLSCCRRSDMGKGSARIPAGVGRWGALFCELQCTSRRHVCRCAKPFPRNYGSHIQGRRNLWRVLTTPACFLSSELLNRICIWNRGRR